MWVIGNLEQSSADGETHVGRSDGKQNYAAARRQPLISPIHRCRKKQVVGSDTASTAYFFFGFFFSFFGLSPRGMRQVCHGIEISETEVMRRRLLHQYPESLNRDRVVIIRAVF